MADAIDRSDPHDPIARQFVPDARELDRRAGREPRSDRRRSVQSRRGDGPSLPGPRTAESRQRLRGLLPVLLPPRNGRAGAGRAVAGGACRGARIHRRRSGDLGSDSQRRRSAGGLGAAARGRGRQLSTIDHVKVVRVHTRVPVVAPERINAALIRALRTDKATFVVLHANHPRELTQTGPRRLRALCRCRHTDAGAIGAVARGERRCGDARRADAIAGRMQDQALLPAPCRSRARHGASAHQYHRRPGVDARAARPRSLACVSRLMCSTFPAATANRRSARII